MAWAVIDDEKESSFHWVLECLKELAENNNIPPPFVMVTDFDKALKNSTAYVYPRLQQQLRLWHIMKNVAFNVKIKWLGSIEGTKLGATLGGEASRLNPEEDVDQQDAQVSTVGASMLDDHDAEVDVGGADIMGGRQFPRRNEQVIGVGKMIQTGSCWPGRASFKQRQKLNLEKTLCNSCAISLNSKG